MAVIGNFKEVPELQFVDFLERLSENEAFVFLRPDPQYYTATNMAMSMMATCVGRYGSPVKASDLQKVSQIGIFATWEIRRKIGELCDQGFFSRKHFGLEEYFTPEEKFFEFIQSTQFERRSA